MLYSNLLYDETFWGNVCVKFDFCFMQSSGYIESINNVVMA